MHRFILAAVLVLGAVPAFAQSQNAGPENAGPPPPDRGYETTQPAVGQAARETGSVLRRGWEDTKQAARKTGSTVAEGWHSIENGVRWGWHHPNGAPPPQGETPPTDSDTQR